MDMIVVQPRHRRAILTTITMRLTIRAKINSYLDIDLFINPISIAPLTVFFNYSISKLVPHH